MQVEIVSQVSLIYSGVAAHVVAPSINGELGIYPGHAALLALLKPGIVRVVENEESNQEEIFYTAGGTIEVQPKKVIVLADTLIRARDVDEAAAKAAEDRAREKLHDKQAAMDYAEVLVELAQAAAQLRAIQQLREHTKR